MMNGRPDPVGTTRRRDIVPVPFALWLTLAATAAATFFFVRPSRRSSAAAPGRQALIAYLHDHLGGSDVAIRVVRRLAAMHQDPESAALFGRLSREFEEDRAVVKSLLDRLGASRRSMKRVAGHGAGAALSVAAGGAPGDLSLFRTLEALSIAVQGKRCLWRALQGLPLPVADEPLEGGHPDRGTPMDYVALEAKAVGQWEALEVRRRALVPRTLASRARPTPPRRPGSAAGR